MNERMIGGRIEREKSKRMLRTLILHIVSLDSMRKKNSRDKSVHAGHAASKSCVPNSKTLCTGHAGTLYFQAW